MTKSCPRFVEGLDIADDVPMIAHRHLFHLQRRGEPLRDYETIVRLIARTTTAKGLRVTCRLDRRRYPLGRRVSDEAFAAFHFLPNAFHGESNYSIHPRTNP